MQSPWAGNATCPHCTRVAQPAVAAAGSHQVCSTWLPGLPSKVQVQCLPLGTEMAVSQLQSLRYCPAGKDTFWAWEGTCPRQCGPRMGHIWAGDHTPITNHGEFQTCPFLHEDVVQNTVSLGCKRHKIVLTSKAQMDIFGPVYIP